MPQDGRGRRRDPELDLEENPPYQERMWKIERVGWALMAAVLLAAAGGLFGHGPLSERMIVATAPHDRSQAAAPLVARITFDRYIRLHSPSAIRISEVSPPDGGGDAERTFSLWLSFDYLGAVELEPMTPRPDTQRIGSEGVSYDFRVRDGRATVVVPFKALKIGRVSGSVRVNNGPPMALGHFVYP